MMTNLITLTIPNDDSTALYHFGKSLIDMSASVSGAREFVVITRDEYENLVQSVPFFGPDGEEINKHHHVEVESLGSELKGAMMDVMLNCDGKISRGYDGHKIFTDTVLDVAAPYVEESSPTTTQQVESLGEAVITINGVEIDSEPASDEKITGCDKSDTPWDERIHSTSKALNVDGTWRLRRKPKDMDEAEWAAFVETVKAELMWKKCDPKVLEQMADAGMDNSGEPQYDGEQHPTNLNHVSIDPAHDKGDETAELTIEPPVTPPGDDFHTDAGVVTEQTVAGIPPLPVPPPVVVAPPVPVQAALSEGIARYGDAMSELAKNDGDVQWDFPRLMTFLTERHGKIDVATVNTLLAQDGLASLQELNAHPDKIGPFVARVKAHLGE